MGGATHIAHRSICTRYTAKIRCIISVHKGTNEQLVLTYPLFMKLEPTITVLLSIIVVDYHCIISR